VTRAPTRAWMEQQLRNATPFGGGRASRRRTTESGPSLSELETIVSDILTATRLEIARGTATAAHFELHRGEIDCNLGQARRTVRVTMPGSPPSA
jgi:hypothetical protein